MKKYLSIYLITFLLLSCSSSNEMPENPSFPEVIEPKLEILINGTKLDNELIRNDYPILSAFNNGYLQFGCLYNGEGHNPNYIDIVLNPQGKLIGCKLNVNYINNTSAIFRNYRNFSSHYFETSIIEHNIQTKKIKFKLKGYLYKNNNNLNSEKVLIEIYYNDFYLSNGYEYNSPVIENGLYSYHPQKFNFNLNNNFWSPTFSFSKGSFVSYDPFMVVLKLNPQTTEGNYAFNHTLNINTIKFYKFNVNTYQYDEFNAIGSFNISYREYHGGNSYTYFGTFNLIVTNPNDANEVYDLNQGEFVVSSPFTT
jgi:hypothetical protein